MNRLQSVSVLLAAASSLAVAAWACGDDTSSGPTGTDAGVGFDGARPSPSPGPVGDDSGGSPDDGGGIPDAGDGGTSNPAVTCKTLLAATPGLPSGTYAIDLDGPGTVYPPITVYCDMTFDGGGWTMIQSFTGANSPQDLFGPTDAGVLVHAPQPGTLGGLADWIVKPLAGLSTQVHIRLSFASDAGADAGTWVTSREPDAGSATQVIANLRNLDVLTKGTDGGFGDWTGPKATAEKLSWVPMYGGGPGTCLNPVETTKYPSIYWACGNFTSMNVLATQAVCRWTYSPDTGNEPMEVFVR